MNKIGNTIINENVKFGVFIHKVGNGYIIKINDKFYIAKDIDDLVKLLKQYL